MKFFKKFLGAFIIFLFVLTVIGFSLGASYYLGINDGDEFSYKLTKFDEQGIEYVTGQKFDIPFSIEGVSIALNVETITDKGQYWEIKWGGITEVLSMVTGQTGDTIEVGKQPDHNRPVTIVCPLDVPSYLSEFYSGISDVSVSDNTVSHTLKNGTGAYSYDKTTGMLDSYIMKNIAGEVVFQFDQSTGSLIPGYNSWLILGVVGSTGLSIILIRKKRIKFN